MTLGDCIADGEARFIDAGIQFGQGTLNAWDEARWLALAALDLPVDSPIDIETSPVNAAQRSRIDAMFERRCRERQPAAYLTQTAWLKGYRFHVDPRVIIPRSFIAELIRDGLTPWRTAGTPVRRICDVCTGSGCLAIMAADQFPEAQVVATDLSTDALAVAAINRAAYRLEARIELVASDVFSALPQQSFDLIISNPPYVPERKRKTLPPEFRCEPDMALIANDHGMAIVRRILQDARRFLAPGGLLVVEIGHEKKACQRLLQREFGQLPVQWVRTAEQYDNVFVVTQSVLANHPWRAAP